jgi:nitroimidazol reductase NimA-like FMN-containing flavoprotein (pyridoxamine 5'-phosphate oxidase superfamily)
LDQYDSHKWISSLVQCFWQDHAMSSPLSVTDRTRVRRRAERASHERAEVHAILDAALVCHLGFVDQRGPVVLPTAFARVGDTLVVHGSSKSPMLLALAGGAEACCTVTLLDGLVLARSAFHHSVNYRSVVIFGRGERIDEPDAKREALRAFFTKLYPGRWEVVRPPTDAELRATLVVGLPIDEAVAKRRTGPPIDDEADYLLPVWAGVAPLTTRAGALEPDARLHPTVDAAVTPPLALFTE